jgi:hypothetical protein
VAKSDFWSMSSLGPEMTDSNGRQPYKMDGDIGSIASPFEEPHRRNLRRHALAAEKLHADEHAGSSAGGWERREEDREAVDVRAR